MPTTPDLNSKPVPAGYDVEPESERLRDRLLAMIVANEARRRGPFADFDASVEPTGYRESTAQPWPCLAGSLKAT